VDQYFNDSTGKGDMGEIDTKGPWNEGDTWQVVDAPAFQDARSMNGPAEIQSEASAASDPDAIRELLIDQMRDLLHAEKQLVKALPKMIEAAQSEQLATIIEQHLAETETQVERLMEGLKILGAPTKTKPCKGMMGLLEEGDEVMREGKKMEPAGADLALIGAAQKVEHYEMAGYITARNLAQQLQLPDLVQLLQLSLAEEANADQLLNQIARPLMSAARMPEPIA
jgi:Mn-containing catalase